MSGDPLPEIGAETLPSDAETMDVAIRGVLGGAPCDELEGMLAAQMPAAHRAAMECYGQASRPGRHAALQMEDLELAVKLARTFAGLTLALAKHRGKGAYTVTVEHVHMRG